MPGTQVGQVMSQPRWPTGNWPSLTQPTPPPPAPGTSTVVWLILAAMLLALGGAGLAVAFLLIS
jgi:hypothetical protein